MEKFNVSSEMRRKMLSDIVGEENAKQVNLAYEKKLLLKNTEGAMYSFIKDLTGLSAKAKEEVLVSLRKTLADKAEKLYDPVTHENLLNEITSDIYSRKYKTEVSLDQAQTLTELAYDVKKARENLNPDNTWKTREDGLKFGAAKVAQNNYVGTLKSEIIKPGFTNPFRAEGIVGKGRAIIENAKISFNFIADNARAIVASFDNSFWFRQGLKVLMNPRFSKIWLDNFVKSFSDIGKTIVGGNKAGDAILDGIKAEIYSRPNYLNGRYEMGKKLDIGTGEEAYPTSWPSRIPILGRLFRASEVAYEAGAMRLRVDIADKMYSMAEKTGIDLTNKVEVGDINEVINSMTGRGRMPVGEKTQKVINSAFFSIKFLKSNIDFLTLHEGRLSSFATKQAGMNLLSVVSATGIVLGIAKALYPDNNKDIFNTTSSNFGKIRIGNNMTIDLTGGVSGLVVLASKIINQKSTSSTTGITTQLGQGYGSQTGMDVLWSFTENKFSPMFGVLRDLTKQQTFAGGKPTLQSEVGGLITPIIVGNISQFKGESGAIQLLGLIADGVGLNTNVYAPSTDWGQSTGVEMQQFKAKIGDVKFKEANDLYNQQYADWSKNMKSNSKYQALSSDDKQTIITKKKAEIKDKIFKQYGFRYKTPIKKILPKF